MNGYDSGGSFLGLGFSHYGGEEAPRAPSSAIDAADSLMKHYLQQCLDFHEDQQHQQTEETSIPQFVTAQHPPPPLPVSAAPPTHSDMPPAPFMMVVSTEQSSVASSVSDPLSHPYAQEAIAKAKAIVQKFQQQHHEFPLQESHASLLPADYRYRRQQELAKEQERLHKATLKNFEYVARREEERLKRQLAQLEETKVLEHQLQEQQAAFLVSRREKQQTLSKAGIGTSRRQALEKQKQRKGHVGKMNDDLSVAIYLAGLPTTVTEDFVKQLFESYGTIRRVHLYRHKQTGELKGDALLVYNVRKVEEKQSIFDAACSQVSLR